MENQNYLTPQQIVQGGQYPFTIGQIRHYLMMRHKNGLDRSVRKIGKRIYLKRDEFEKWIDSQISKRGMS